MQTHVKVLGILFLICAGFLALIAAAIPLGLGIASMFLGQSGDPDARTGLFFMGLFGTLGAAIFGVLALLWGIGGYGILNHKPWARILAIILCAMSLIKIPFGTALGVYGLWVMFSKETEGIFTKS
jgi:hypothetical protein